MKKTRCFTALALVALLLASVGTRSPAFSQAGSTGGTLGKTDKSASGEREEAPQGSAHQHRAIKPAVRADVSGSPTGGPKAGRPIGCFRDTNAPVDIDGYLERSQANTPSRCVAICKSKGFRYAGVQYGESCLCGNSYGRYGAANNCNMACTGDPNETCGGGFANFVYATGAR